MAGGAFRYLTVIGLGLIGGSLAMAARQRFPDLVIQGVDPRAEALQFALKHEIINEASLTLPERFAHSPQERHLVVLACHLSQSMEILQSLEGIIQPEDNVLITDIGSCKRTIVDVGREQWPKRFIAGHPMAGKALSGIENATALLFVGKPYLLCPHASTDPELLGALEQFVADIGARPQSVDADRHDEYMAYVSHLPQLYAVLLANVLERKHCEKMLSCHGGGIEEQLRLAASPYAMWGDILRQNGDNLAQALGELRTFIDEALIDLQNPASAKAEETWLARFERANHVEGLFQVLRAKR
jgi:prephenate dehydrogenase